MNKLLLLLLVIMIIFWQTIVNFHDFYSLKLNCTENILSGDLGYSNRAVIREKFERMHESKREIDRVSIVSNKGNVFRIV